MYVYTSGSYTICPMCKGIRVSGMIIDGCAAKCAKCNGFGVLIKMVTL